MKKLKREELRKILLEEIEKVILNEADGVKEVKVAKRGSEITHPGGKKEYKLKVPIGFKKLMFVRSGDEKERKSKKITVNGLDSEVTQGQHRVTVPHRGTTYYISGPAGKIKVKPVR